MVDLAVAGKESRVKARIPSLEKNRQNLILLINLAWSAWLYACFLRHRGSFAVLERWQIAYLHGQHWWLSCSRPCSATVDAPSWALHLRIVLTSRLPFSNCEKCGQFYNFPHRWQNSREWNIHRKPC